MSASNPFENEESRKLASKIVYKMTRKRVIGENKKQLDTISNWFPSHQQNQVKEIIKKNSNSERIPIGTDPHGRLSLTSYEEAQEFIESQGRETGLG